MPKFRSNIQNWESAYSRSEGAKSDGNTLNLPATLCDRSHTRGYSVNRVLRYVPLVALLWQLHMPGVAQVSFLL